MKIYEIGTGYTSIPATISAATEIVIEQLTKELIKQNADVTIVDIYDDNRAETNLPITEVKIPKKIASTDTQLGIFHKLKRVIYSVSLSQKLKKILKAEKDKVVFHFHNQYNMFFFMRLVPKRLRKKCITAYTNHSGIWRLDWSETEKTLKTRYFQEADCMKKADILYLLNDETKENVIEHLDVDENKIVRISNGVNTEIYKPLPETEKHKIKEKYGLTDKKVILQVGSVYENKGQLRAIKLLLPVMKANPNLVYLYAGGIVSEEYQNQITEFVKGNNIENQVRYLGMLSPGKELNELYNTAAATVFPSQYEAFSLVVIEAMSAGIPVLINDCSTFSLGEGCIHYNDKTFADTVNTLINSNNCDAYYSDARRNAENNYSWARVAKDYLKSWNNF